MWPRRLSLSIPLRKVEFCALQGIGPSEAQEHGLSALPDTLLRNLAGNAFCCNIVVAILVGLLQTM